LKSHEQGPPQKGSPQNHLFKMLASTV